jgi:hypothetical protein
MPGNPLAILRIEGLGSLPILAPWIAAGGISIANGLTEFSGHEIVAVANSVRLATLVGVLLLGVVAPTLTLLLMGKRSGKAASAPARGVYLVSVIITATFAGFVLPMGYVASRVTASLQSAQAVQENKDHIINDLNVIAWKIREYRIVPKALGGGGGEVSGYVPPAGIAQTEDAKYTVQPAVPGTTTRFGGALVTIHASSKKYSGAEVDVTLYDSGFLQDWTYTGQFQ